MILRSLDRRDLKKRGSSGFFVGYLPLRPSYSPLKLRGDKGGLLPTPARTKHSVYQVTLHCSKNASHQLPRLSDTLNEIRHVLSYRSGCALRRPTPLQALPLDNKSPGYRDLCCTDGRISFRRTVDCVSLPTRPFPHRSDYVSTPVAVVLMLDHFVRIP